MQIVESSDGTIKVVELDPTKMHIVVADFDCGINPNSFYMVDGSLWMKRPGTTITFVEAETLPRREDVRFQETR